MTATATPHPAAAYHERRREDTGERALSAAVEIFHEEGIEGLTIEAVTARSGVAKTTIYRRWKNSRHLAVSVLDRVLRTDEGTQAFAHELRGVVCEAIAARLDVDVEDVDDRMVDGILAVAIAVRPGGDAQ